MPKRAREASISKSKLSPKSTDTDHEGHTPKWTRSSASPPSASLTGLMPEVTSSSNKVHLQDMQCMLPGHAPITFASAADFEVHYAKEHNNQCTACKAVLPSSWTLKLHQDEQHDPLIATQRDKGEKTYRCFLQDCEKITLTPQKRRLHLIDKHGFPKDYDFRIVDSGSRRKRSLLRDQNQRGPPQRRRISDVGLPGWRNRTTSSTALEVKSESRAEFEHCESSKDVQDSRSEMSSVAEDAGKDSSEPPKVPAADTIDSLGERLTSLSFVPLSVRMKNKKKS